MKVKATKRGVMPATVVVRREEGASSATGLIYSLANKQLGYMGHSVKKIQRPPLYVGKVGLWRFFQSLTKNSQAVRYRML